MTRTGGQGARSAAAARPGATTSGKRASGGRARRSRSQPRRWLAALPLLAKIIGIPAFAAALAAGLLYVRLLHGPITLDFLIQPIERAIAEEVAGVRVGIEAVALRLGADGQVEFELKNVRVTDAGDVPLALAPSALVVLSRKALLSGRIAPESVDLISPRLSLFYTEDGALSLKFAAPAEPAAGERLKPPALRGAPAAAPAAAPAIEGDSALGRIDLVKVLSEASARARRRERASAYLRGVGLKSATVVIDNGNRKSVWRVPELDIDLDHRRSRSSIAGRAKIDSLAGPWTINFRTYEHASTKTLQLALSVQELVPRGLARALPQLAVLEGLDVPVWGDAHLELSSSGEILSGTIGIDAAPGRVLLPWLAATPLKIDGGHLSLSYSSATRRFEIAPSVLVWGDSRVQFTGSVVQAAQGADGPGWSFDVKSAGGWLGAEPPHLQRLQIDDWSARGHYSPERARVVLSQFRLQVAGAEVSAEGDVTDMAGSMKARLDGKIGPMPASVLKTLWPAALAPKSREWVVRRLVRGWVQGGTFQLASGPDTTGPGWASTTGPNHGSLTLEGGNLAFAILDNWPTLEVPRALLRLDDNAFEMNIPDASLAVGDGRRVSLKGSSFTIDMHEPLPRTGHVVVKAQGPLAAAVELLDREPFQLLQKSGLTLTGIDGKVESQLSVSIPLGEAFEPRDVKLEGKTRISDGRLVQALGPYDVHGANIVIDMTSTAVEARGEMLVKGVVAKASWQHIYGAAADKQPPLRITTTLDNSYRTQLGLDAEDLVQGDVGVEITVARDARGERNVHLRADLLNAEVLLESVAWRKPKGRPSVFEFDVIKGAGAHPIELHNVRMVGDNVAIEGWMGLGADYHVREFRFPTFSLNVVTSLSTHGKVRPDGIWEVTAKGPTYDGRDLFRTFFDVAHLADQSAKVRPGLDLKAEVETVVGYSDATLRNVKMTLSKRASKLTGLDVRGVLEGGKPFAAIMRHEAGRPRLLLAEATDAGLFFKLVGFYPNAVGGLMTLEVDLDGRGAAERTGTLWARDFVVLGDPIITEVLQNVDGTQQGGQRRVVREQLEFEIMRVPFEIGHGQFVMNDAAIKGLLVSATMRGTVDFRQRRLAVGGTYVPMSGLMRVPAEIPVIGPILTGPRGEGLFGITFAINGPIERPQVLVNPLSALTPGILREIFQMTPENPRIIPRGRPAPRGDGTRASSAPAASPSSEPVTGPGIRPEVGGSWTAEQSDRSTPRRK